MGKITMLIIVAAFFVAAVSAAGDCPSYSKVTSCSPKCLQDSECSSIGGKCCPNLCNYKSCVQPNQLSNSGSAGSKGSFSSSGGSGTYCGNTKCGPHEKCQNDRSTSRPKCVRA